VGGDRAEEQDEIVGYHLEQAFRNREALGPLDEQARGLARQASDRLAAAGLRALGRHDIPAVANLLGRAEALLEPADPARLALLPELAFAQWEMGLAEQSKAVMSEALARADPVGSPETAAHTSLMHWFLTDDVEGEHDRVRSDAREAAAVFERWGNERGLARAWHLIGIVEWELGRAGKQLPALERALDYAQRAGDTFQTAEVLLSVTAALVRGPTPVRDGIARAEGILEQYRGNRGAEAYICHALAHLRARLGEFDAAREMAARYRGFLHDTGQVLGYWRSAEVMFDIEMLAGDTQAADDVAEEAYAILAEKGDRWPYLCSFLAQARYTLGRFEEAAEVAEIAASSSIAIERALGLGVLARVRATEGDAAAAEPLITEAVAIVERTDFLFDRGTVFLDLAEVTRLLERAEESRAALGRALGEFESKGDLVSARRTRGLLERPS
jgi:tetratricopeptide (TPR) repeat protein